MLVSWRRASGGGDRQGCLRAALAELQHKDARSKDCDDELRQRLLALGQRLERVQTLGNEYARVGFSEHVEAVLAERAPQV